MRLTMWKHLDESLFEPLKIIREIRGRRCRRRFEIYLITHQQGRHRESLMISASRTHNPLTQLAGEVEDNFVRDVA